MEIKTKTKEEICKHLEYDASPFGDVKNHKELRICKACKKEGVFDLKPPEVCGKCKKPKEGSERDRCHCGRPIEYSREILKKAEQYLDDCEDEEVQVVKQSSEKYEMFDNKLKVRLPSKGGLAVRLKVSRDTLYAWAALYPEFSDIMERLGAIQEQRLIDNGLAGDYNSTITKLVLVKHGYRDAVDVKSTEVPIDEELKKKGDAAVDEYLNEKKK